MYFVSKVPHDQHQTEVHLGRARTEFLGVLSAPLEHSQNPVGGSKTLLDAQRLKLQR